MQGNLCLLGKQDKERFEDCATSIITIPHNFQYNWKIN